MKYTKIFILLISILFFTCERDDICAEDTITTPRLLLDFFDVDDSETLKSVIGLTVYGEGLVTDENGNPTEPTVTSDTTLSFNSTINNIALPLRIGIEGEETTTRYIFEMETSFRLDSDDATLSNTDIVVITYIPEFVYVSRACGFKSIFTELNITIEGGDDGAWIDETIFPDTFENTITVENENTTHVQLLH